MRCAVCGCTKTVGNGVCEFLCNWILEGWIGWNARDQKVVYLTAEAMKVAAANGEKRLSYPKMVVLARSLGWKGRENPITTMVRDTAPAKPEKQKPVIKPFPPVWTSWTGLGARIQ